MSKVFKVGNPIEKVGGIPGWPIVKVLNWIFVVVGYAMTVMNLTHGEMWFLIPFIQDFWTWCTDVWAWAQR